MWGDHASAPCADAGQGLIPASWKVSTGLVGTGAMNTPWRVAGSESHVLQRLLGPDALVDESSASLGTSSLSLRATCACAGRLVVFGGKTQEGRRLGDVWAMSTGSKLFHLSCFCDF